MNKLKEYAKRQVQQIFKANETKLHPLTYLFWECTLRCNLNCRHCGSDCSISSKYKDMPFDDFYNAALPLIKKYGKHKITVVITGGEPLLRDDLAECGRRLALAGFGWGIVSNGYAYNEEKHNELLSAGMGSITISLDGTSDTHNLFRRSPNSFNHAIKAIDLIAASPQLNYDIVTCVHNGNLEQLQDIKNILIQHKVKAWRLFTIAPIGRAAQDQSLQLDGNGLRKMLDFITESRKEKKIDIKFSCEAYTGQYENKVRDWGFFCRAGINIASVLIDGSISACPNINRSFSQGNIYNDSLIDVWENKFQLMRNRQWMKCGPCATCKEWKVCGGGAVHLWNENRNGIMECIYNKIS